MSERERCSEFVTPASDADDLKLALGYIPKGTIVKVNGFPFRLIEAANIESHADNFRASTKHDAMAGTTPQVVAGRPVARSESVLRKNIPEGRGSLPAGALGSGSPFDVAREANPGSAVPGGEEDYAVALLKQIRSEWYRFTSYSQLKQDIDAYLERFDER